jgi:lysophospholipase L1-like esterase
LEVSRVGIPHPRRGPFHRSSGLLASWLVAPAVAADDDHVTRQVELKKGDRIIFFGDSLTSLAVDDTSGKHFTKGYVRVDKDVIAKKPTIVVIQIGCNDARRVPLETFKSSLNELHDKLKAAGIQAIQCSLTSVGEKHDGTNANDAKMEEFAQAEREIAKSKDVPLNDLRKAFVAYWKEHNQENKPSGILTYDGNHFNQTGHDFVAEQMLKKFK